MTIKIGLSSIEGRLASDGEVIDWDHGKRDSKRDWMNLKPQIKGLESEIAKAY